MCIYTTYIAACRQEIYLQLNTKLGAASDYSAPPCRFVLIRRDRESTTERSSEHSAGTVYQSTIHRSGYTRLATALRYSQHLHLIYLDALLFREFLGVRKMLL